jgi:hypothetical protein
MASIARVLEGAGHATFLPQRDGLEVLAMRLATLPLARSAALGFADRLMRRAIFAVDVYQLVEGCDAIVWNLNGRVPDEGAVVEATLAFATAKPLVAYKDDARSVFDGQDNPMLTGLFDGQALVRNVAEIPGALAVAMGAASRHAAATPPTRSAALGETLRFGAGVWRLLEAAPFLRGGEERHGELLAELERIAADAR